MNTVAAIRQTSQQAPRGFALTPQTLDEAMQFAGLMAKSSIVPKDYQGNPGNILVAIQWGAEIGLAPLQAMQSIAVINGRPSIWGDAMLALVRGSGLLEYIKEDPTDSGCTCILKRRGDQFEVERTFTQEDAKKAGLWGKQGPWQQHPKRMMQMRARAFALRDTFADVLRGVHIGEESQDAPPQAKDMGQADEVKQQAPSPPATRADKTRDALAKRKPAALPPPALADVLGAISVAGTLDALKATGELAQRLEGDEKQQARAAYMERKAALEAPPLAPGAAVERLQACQDLESLAMAFDDVMTAAQDEAERERLTAAYTGRMDELEGN